MGEQLAKWSSRYFDPPAAMVRLGIDALYFKLIGRADLI